MTRVLFVAARGTQGGPNQSLLTLLEALEGKVSRVLAAPKPLIDLARSRGVIDDGWALGDSPILGRGERLLAAVRLTVLAFEHRDSIDVVHANNLSALNVGGMAGIVSGSRIVAWSHTSRLESGSARMASLWDRMSGNLSWVAVSDLAAELLRESGIPRQGVVEVVPNPLSPSKIVERSPGQRVEVAYLGGPAPRKGYHLVGSVVELLVDVEGIAWHVVAGPSAATDADIDPVTARFKELQNPNLKLTNWLTTSQVKELYARAGIVFCPSYRESFGMVAAEAMANGIPVVSTDIPAFRDLIGDNEAGILFQPGDAQAAAEAIRTLARDEGMRQQIGDAGKRRASLYGADAVAQRMLEIYRRDGNPNSRKS